MRERGITRRELIRRGGDVAGLLALPAIASAGAVSDAAAATTTTTPPVAPDPYAAIGVRPLINARGTYTIISGSTMLPDVRAAMDAASRRYVHLDELAEAIGARLATLTQAEWGLVTSGCAAALTHGTAAAVAGGNPDLHIRIPNLAGFPRDEAIIPSHSRNVYDAAVRAVGVRVIEVESPEQLEAAFGPRTAMVYILAGPEADKSALNLAAIAPLAKARGVPILVDAAAEVLTIPNVHLQNGATLVAYSGGKCLRGPQTGGLLLGRKDLVRAAWVHSAPHHGYSRGLKVGKEEAIAMLAAVELWVKRDHDAEWKQWMAWLDHIARRVSDGRRRDELYRPACRDCPTTHRRCECCGIAAGSAFRAMPWLARCSIRIPASLSLPHGGTRPVRRASPSRRTCCMLARKRSSPIGCTRCCRMLRERHATALRRRAGRRSQWRLGRPHSLCGERITPHAPLETTRQRHRWIASG